MDSNTTTTLPHSGPSESDGIPHDSRRPLLRGTMATFAAITIIFMCIRLYLRVYVLKAWRLDDSVFILGACLTIVHIAFVWLGMTYGSLGLHIWDAAPESLKKNVEFILPSMLLHVFAFNVAKAVFLLQYRRAFAIRSVQLFCNIFLAIVLIILVAMTISGGVLMSAFTKPNYVYGQNQHQFLIWSYVNAGLNLATDIVIFILPLPLVGRLRLAPMQKAGLIASFAVGIFTAGISVWRIVDLPLGVDHPDIYYEAIPVVILTVAEPLSAVVCACVPIMKPILCCTGRAGGSSQGSQSYLARSSDKSAANGTTTSMVAPRASKSPMPNTVYVTNMEGQVQDDLGESVSTEKAKELSNIDPEASMPDIPAATGQQG